MPKLLLLFFSLFSLSCRTIFPGGLDKLPDGFKIPEKRATISLASGLGKTLSVKYLGCGGLSLVKAGEGILIDPFFSNQGIGTLMISTLFNKRKIASDPEMINMGLNSILEQDSLYSRHIKAIFVAHSHYDHLMDVPAVYAALEKKPDVYLNESGQNICSTVIDFDNIKLLEDIQTTNDCEGPPVWVGEKIRVYPILAGHNPHTKHIKFFDGSVSFPINYFSDPYAETRANDWLEGNTYSFLIDYLGENNEIELRIFVQSSSCNPNAGIPPASLLDRPVDVAFLGVASYEASPFYPETLISKIQPQKIVWVHWEDFFRSYSKQPKTVRATNVVCFFKQAIVEEYQLKSWMPWPRALLTINY